ncbi:hypothetical protein ALI22I_19955 [Saccharothrix sp. ALI-22-I]|uniref:hypothetical protein n=1 Tax=Saccharothrix sp. ALI-22-I TaxID=1933778 RepID=UPI00097C93F8|nr:hypothetical protein [Saccharothrix sp. ALI-22-I]ONI88022.1 hypothetical protein ALI22I_19955 [Saccharothrix sp. ALI-22-I]
MKADYWQVSSPADRLALSRRRAAATATEIRSWFALRRPNPRFVRFAGHFDVLEAVLALMHDRVAGEHDAICGDTPTGAVHDRCRQIEASLDLVRRVFGWYRDKYDQRLVDRVPLEKSSLLVKRRVCTR